MKQYESVVADLKSSLTELERKLDDREADLINAKREERGRIATIAHEYLNASICDICYEDNCGDEFSCTKGKYGEVCKCHSRINDARARLEQAIKGQ